MTFWAREISEIPTITTVHPRRGAAFYLAVAEALQNDRHFRGPPKRSSLSRPSKTIVTLEIVTLSVLSIRPTRFSQHPNLLALFGTHFQDLPVQDGLAVHPRRGTAFYHLLR
jgi:hypothetical protein